MGEFLDFFKKKKNIISVLILGILILALPLGINLIHQQQIIKSRATADPIVIKSTTDVFQVNGQWVAKKDAKISLEITSPLGPPAHVGIGATGRGSQ